MDHCWEKYNKYGMFDHPAKWEEHWTDYQCSICGAVKTIECNGGEILYMLKPSNDAEQFNFEKSIPSCGEIMISDILK